MSALLPPNSTALHRTTVGAMVGAVALEIPIRDLKSWNRIPDGLLSYLAWELSVDIWNDDWPVAMKRDVVRRAVEMHRLKGTLEGIRQHVRLAGGELLWARVPPDEPYLDPEPTEAEEEAYRARFRQLRMYPFRKRVNAGFGTFFNGAFGQVDLFLGGGAVDASFPINLGDAADLGVYTVVFDPITDLETPVSRVERLRRTADGNATSVVYVDDDASLWSFLDDDPQPEAHLADGAELGTVALVDVPYQFGVDDVRVVTDVPQAQSLNRPVRKALKSDRRFGELYLSGEDDTIDPELTFLPPDDADLHIYDVAWLFESRRAGPVPPAGCFLGDARLGIPPFHAMLGVRTRFKSAADEVFLGGGFVDGFTLDAAPDTGRVLDSIVISKAERDKVLVTTRTVRPATVGSWLPVGSARVGQLVPTER